MNIKTIYLSVISIMFPIYANAALNHNASDWVGLYSGLHAGYAWGNAETSTTITAGPNTYFNAFDLVSIERNGNLRPRPHDPTGGIQLGYDQCISNNLIVGIEADFGSFLFNKSVHGTSRYPLFVSTGYTIEHSVDAHWLATLRPKFGYVYNQLLAYVTGGVALTNFNFKQVYTDDLFSNFPAPPGNNAFMSFSKRRLSPGWVLGGGLEYMLCEHLSAGVSYLHTRFKTSSYDSGLQVIIGGVLFMDTFHSTAKLQANEVRAQLNWRV